MTRNNEGGENYSRVSFKSFRDRGRELWPIKAAAELRKTTAGERARPLRSPRLQGDGGPRATLRARTLSPIIVSQNNEVFAGERGRSVHRSPEAMVEGGEERLCKRSVAEGRQPFISLHHHRESYMVFLT